MHDPTRNPRAALAVPVLAVAILVAACGGSVVATVSPASVSPSTAAQPEDPTPVLGPTPVTGGEEAAAVVTALNIEFTPGKIGVPANVPFTLVLDNRDAGIPHNLEVRDATGAVLVKSEVVVGPTRQAIPMPALAPGDYPFNCTVHPNMVGVLIAQP
jgi:hypothetical protein